MIPWGRRLPPAFACALALAGCTLASEGWGDPREGEGEASEGEGEGEGEGDVGEGEGEGEGEDWNGVVDRDRSLVWTRADLLDDPDTVSLARVVGAAADSLGVNPGVLFDAWLRRFATTAHSERAGPAQLADQLRDTLGADPALWDLAAVPFKVTGIHNRVDLLGRFRAGDITIAGTGEGDAHCGQLRVSFASTDPIFRPFHVLFLFAMPAATGDVASVASGDVGADGLPRVTCRATALAWARLSDLEGDAFLTAARALFDEHLIGVNFLLAESVELTVSPWEWRQWTPAGVVDGVPVFDNPPLFEQIDSERINQPGATRDAFLTFVDDNAAALDARTLLLPAQFRSPSVRVAQGVPWVPLDLSGLAGATSAAYPELRRHIEIIGCAACHTADAEFVQTREDRTFSPFYTKELVARGALLDELVHGVERAIPFGPLQDAPVLPP